MSLTVSQLMELPCLRRAKVIAGHNSLSRIVTCVSVLEYSTPTEIQKQFYDSIEFWGSELVLTGFCSIADDIEAQCTNIRKMAEAGEVGMILYYVGIIMPRVDPKLIELANELDFVLICMPENEPSLRYSEVIHEVMDAIIRDQLNNPTFTVDLLEQMSKLPRSQQTVKTILRITSDRLRASAVITDAEYRVLSEASWPRNRSPFFDDVKSIVQSHPGNETCWELAYDHPVWLYRAEIHLDSSSTMYLLAFSEGGRFEPVLWKQAVEGVRLGMGLWGQNHDHIDLSELVRAIIQDEPIKMRRLGDLYHIDVESLSDMWILSSQDKEPVKRWVEPVRKFLKQYTTIGLCERYDNDILIFPTGSRTLREAQEIAAALTEYCVSQEIPATLTCCPALRKTSDVKYAYEITHTYLKDARSIFSKRTYFTISEIEFAKECREIATGGKDNTTRYLSLLDRIQAQREGEDIIRTISTYLLDKNSSVTETASALFVHKNTVKFRLQKASDLLGFRVGDVPHSKNLFYALALLRLLSSPIPKSEN